MIESLKGRWILILTVLVAAIIWTTPNFYKFGENDWWFSKSEINYGLDIQGGLHLVLGVDVTDVLTEKTARLANNFKSQLNEENVATNSVDIDPENPLQIIVTLAGPEQQGVFEQYITKYYPQKWQILSAEGNIATLKYFETQIASYKKQIIEQAIEVLRNRVDAVGLKEPNISAQGTDRILVQLPGVENATETKKIIYTTAKLVFHIVNTSKTVEQLNTMIQKAEVDGAFKLGDPKKGELAYADYIKRINKDLASQFPKGTELVFEKIETAENLAAGRTPFLIEKTSDLTGDLLEDASVSFDQYGKPEVTFRFGVEGRRKFAELTEKAAGGFLAIVLDDVIKSAPSVERKIDSDSARITLGSRDYNTSLAEAKFIATTLRAGALPAALEQLEERTVGPTLGADSIAKGKKAGIVGGILVLIFMLFYYRFLGFVANLALAFNVLLILAILTSLGATLTLPGVAGIVLTVGMAVDANVIIFERIKEELRKGSGLNSAIKNGFGHALSAIVDANITTAAVCIVLMYFGTGPVRGFAVTLICGIVTSMFTSIFFSRSFIELAVTKWNVKNVVKV